MDVTIYPNIYCDESPSKAHYFIYLGGNIWRCKYCWKPEWAPVDWDEAGEYSVKIKMIGVTRAYKYFVSDNPRVLKSLIQLEEIKLLRQALPDDEFERAVIALLAKDSHTFAKVEKIMYKEEQDGTN